MGFALAEEFAARGAEVHLVCGPTPLVVTNTAIKRTDVVSAAELYEACMDLFPSCDIAILSAAVSDFTPATVSTEKIKKGGASMSLELHKTKDILSRLGKITQPGQLLSGFALETETEVEDRN